VQHTGIKVGAQYSIYALLPFDTIQPGKCGADNHGLEMLTITFNNKMGAIEPGSNPFIDLLRGQH
jgi:hypothetical protein